MRRTLGGVLAGDSSEAGTAVVTGGREYGSCVRHVKAKQLQVTCLPRRPPKGFALLETQGVDRIERRGAPGGVEPEADPDSRANNQPRDGPAKRENQIGLEPRREQVSAHDTEDDPENSASLRDENGLSQKLPENVAAPRTDRFADPDFFRPLRHAHEHD